MKKIAVFIMCIMTVCAVYAEGEKITFSPEAVDMSSVRLVFPQDQFFTKGIFRYSDNSLLPDQEAKELFSIVPENASLLGDAKAAQITEYTLLGLSVASTAGIILMAALPNIQNADVISDICGYATFACISGGVISDALYQKKLHAAANNYNLYILGLPVQ